MTVAFEKFALLFLYVSIYSTQVYPLMYFSTEYNNHASGKL